MTEQSSAFTATMGDITPGIARTCPVEPSDALLEEHPQLEQFTGRLDPRYRPPVGHLFTLPAEELIAWGDRAERTRRLAQVRRIRVERAREDFGAFMEYVFADESTGEPFRQQWFHDEWSRAWDTRRRVLIIAPRDHGKTSQIVGRVLYELGKNPNLRIKVVCAADGRAKERLFEVKQHIEHNRRLREVFPNLRPDEGAEWSKHKIVVERTARHRDASVEALGITSSATGGRCDLLIADDVVDSRNALSFPALRKQIKQSWKSDWTNLLEPESRIWYICTLWHKDDLSHELMGNKTFTTLFYAVGEDFGSLWPGKWSSELLKLRYDEIGSAEFNRGFRNQAIDLDAQIVRPQWFQYAALGEDPAFLEAFDRLVYFTSYDTAVGQTAAHDYFAACTIAVDPVAGHVWIVDAWHARITVQRQSDMVHREWLKFRPFRVLIEKVGQAVLDEWILNDHPEMTGEIEVTKPRVGKAERLLAVTPLLEGGRVTFADHLNPNGLSWEPARGSLVHELEDFPVGAHDDLVDAFSQALAAARQYFLDAWASGGDNTTEIEVTFGDGEEGGGDYPF
jgi:phage terminase large subunit-like protein